MAGPQATLSASLKHDKFSDMVRKRSTSHNASWESMSSSSSSSSCFSSNSSSHEQQRVWPLAISLKEQTRQALFREFGLPDRPSSSSRTGTDTIHPLLRRRKLNTSTTNSNSRITLGRTSREQLAETVEARMMARAGSTITSRRTSSLDKRFASSPHCVLGKQGELLLRRTFPLATIRPATVSELQTPPLKRASLFRQAIKQQQQEQQQS